MPTSTARFEQISSEFGLFTRVIPSLSMRIPLAGPDGSGVNPIGLVILDRIMSGSIKHPRRDRG